MSRMTHDDLTAISLFSGGGIGDLGLRQAGVETLLMNEIVPERALMAAANFPDSLVVAQDIYHVVDQIKSETIRLLDGRELFMILATPPCQGMSANGAGKMLSNYRKGLRPRLDPRNQLILPALSLVKDLRPKWFVIENVTSMRNTLIEYNGELRRIIDVVREFLCDEYEGESYDVQFADYGIPQRRKRLITIYTRDSEVKAWLRASGKTLLPTPSHSSNTEPNRLPWVTLREAIGHFPPLDARSLETATDPEDPLHTVPILDERKYWWVEHTPEGETAFSNQCVAPGCGFHSNARHGTSRVGGVNQSLKDTPIYCEKCGSLLPRPSTIDADGSIRLMSGYTSSYKRMRWDEPSSTLTQNFMYACSDNKIHPSENRVLSISEALSIQTISEYHLVVPMKPSAKKIPLGLLKDVIGESIPPRFVEILARHLIDIHSQVVKKSHSYLHQGSLFDVVV